MNEIQKPLNVREAAEFLGLKPSYIYNLLFFGKLKGFKPGGKKLLFRIADLEAYAYKNAVGGAHLGRANAILNTAQKRKPRRKARV
jgi:excisionase family DNA binding protein